MTSHDLESVALTPARIAGQARRGDAGVINAVTPYRISDAQPTAFRRSDRDVGRHRRELFEHIAGVVIRSRWRSSGPRSSAGQAGAITLRQGARVMTQPGPKWRSAPC